MIVELMQSGSWHQVLQHWRTRDVTIAPPTRDDLHAYARCAEVLQDWETHREVVNVGLEAFPEDASFLARSVLRQAMQAYEAGHWRLAIDLFSALRSSKSECWPYAVSYYRWHAFLKLKLSLCQTAEEQLGVIDYWAYFKNANLFSRQAVGLEEVIRLTWNEADGERLLPSLVRLVDFLKLWDSPLIELNQDVMQVLIGDFANACKCCLGSVLELPNGYLSFLARLFLMASEVELYSRLREAFINTLATEAKRHGGWRDVNLYYHLAYQYEIAEQADLKAMQELLQREFSFTPRIAEKMFSLGNLYLGNTDIGSGKIWTYDEADQQFRKLVQGKRIAIVGPADVGLCKGEEIDSFDVVVRFNYRRSLQLDPKVFGSRTDVSFYIYQDLKDGESDYVEAMNELRFVAVDNISLECCDWLSRVVSPMRIRLETWRFDTCPFVFGSPNAVQRAIMDLVRFSPAEIKVFNSNLFLSLDYSGGYRDRSKNPFPDFSRHDPISNFIFTQKVYRFGLIRVDSVLEQILELTPDQYFSKLVAAYC